MKIESFVQLLNERGLYPFSRTAELSRRSIFLEDRLILGHPPSFLLFE
jgi:hypothetical protein